MYKINGKKGDIESIIYIVLFLAIAGILVFLVSHINNEFFTAFEDHLNESEYNNTEAQFAAQTFKEKNQSQLWDYAFLGIFFGSLIAIGLSAYAVKISPIFYWVYGMLSLMVLALGTILSNFWQDIAADPEFATTITYFPITNAILGTYYPMVVTFVIVIAMVILFAKSPEREEGYV